MRRSARGFSLIEVTVVLGVVCVLLLVVYAMIDDTLHATMFNESHNDLAILSQRAVNQIQEEVLQARSVFEENAVGDGYRGALQIPAAYPRWTTSLLPVIQPATSLGPDAAGTRFTGNSLLVARQLAPLTLTYDDDNNASTPEVEFLADRYRFEYFFLSSVGSRRFARSPFTLDLMRSESVDFADFFQLSSLSAAHVRAIVPKVRAAGMQRAWNPGQPVDNAFHELTGALDGSFDPPVRQPSIAIARTVSLFPELRGGRISAKMDYSVAYVPSSPFPLRVPVNVYARTDVTRPGFPSGFEVKISGPAGNRQVLTRVLLMAHYGARNYEAQQGFVTTAARF